MSFIKRLILATVLGLGFAGVAAADQPKTPWSQADHSPPDNTGTTATVTGVHSLTTRKMTGYEWIQWKVDVRVEGAKDKELVVELELCNAAGQPFLRRDGSTVRLRASVTPDSNSFHAEGLEFKLNTRTQTYGFWDLYGHGATEITFRVIVREDESGKVISKTDVMKLTGVQAKLTPPGPKATDNPGLDDSRNRSRWNRLIYG